MACGKGGRPLPWPDRSAEPPAPQLSILGQDAEGLRLSIIRPEGVKLPLQLRCLGEPFGVESAGQWLPCSAETRQLALIPNVAQEILIENMAWGSVISLSVHALTLGGLPVRSRPVTWRFIAPPALPKPEVDATADLMRLRFGPLPDVTEIVVYSVRGGAREQIARLAVTDVVSIPTPDADALAVQALAGPSGLVAGAISAPIPLRSQLRHLEVPQNISVIVMGGKLRVYWDPVEGALSYDIAAGPTADALTVTLAEGYVPTASSWSGQDSGQFQFVGIRAVDRQGRKSDWGIAEKSPME